MPSRCKWVVERLTSRNHDRKSFSCGNEKLDRYIQKQASQDVKRKLAKVFIARLPKASKVLAFYTLSAADFNKDSLPPELIKRLPYSDIPAVLLGRLAVDITQQGKGLGKFLLIDAFRRVIETSRSVLGINAIVVRAKDSGAATDRKSVV